MSIEDTISRLVESSKDINSASDELSKSFKSIQDLIAKLNIGIKCEIQVYTKNNPQLVDYAFGYARIEEKWLLYVKQDDKVWSVDKAPRYLRIKAVDAIPQFLDALIDATEAVTKRTYEASLRANEMIKAISK